MSIKRGTNVITKHVNGMLKKRMSLGGIIQKRMVIALDVYPNVTKISPARQWNVETIIVVGGKMVNASMTIS